MLTGQDLGQNAYEHHREAGQKENHVDHDQTHVQVVGRAGRDADRDGVQR